VANLCRHKERLSVRPETEIACRSGLREANQTRGVIQALRVRRKHGVPCTAVLPRLYPLYKPPGIVYG